MTFSDVVGVIAVVVGVLAMIWGVYVYRWSAEHERRSERAAEKLGSEVERLRSLYEQMHSDSFGLASRMFDTVATAWSQRGSDQEPVAQAAQPPAFDVGVWSSGLKTDISEAIAREFSKLSVSSSPPDQTAVKRNVDRIVEEALTDSRVAQAQARTASIDAEILKRIAAKSSTGQLLVRDIFDELESSYGSTATLTGLRRLRDSGQLFFEGEAILPQTELRLKQARVGQ